MIAGDGQLAAFPFATLPAPSGSKPLITEHEIVIEPSASAVAILRREMTGRRIPPKDVAVLADPVFDLHDARFHGAPEPTGAQAPVTGARGLPDEMLNAVLRDAGAGLPRLPHTRDEANDVIALTTPERSVALLDFRASKTAAMDPELANYRVVHFATHGFPDTIHPGLSGLALSFYDENGRPVDGFLRLNDIFNLRLPVQLVVLSACQTGQGKAVRGEGLVGLTRGFMYAGAASLAVSLWNVNDVSTAQLMKRFYKGLLGSDHLRPAAALRAAQLSLMQESDWKHPYFWAPFIVEGEWR